MSSHPLPSAPSVPVPASTAPRSRKRSVSLTERLHEAYVFDRRVQVLAAHFARLLPRGARVLDVGCGDGQVAREILRRRPDLEITGLEVLLRPTCQIPLKEFDGTTIPLGDDSVDAVMMVDVLHHTDDPRVLLAEAARVSREAVFLKDHLLQGPLAELTLKFMDEIGNLRHGVRLPYNYWTRRQWQAAFADLGLVVDVWQPKLRLYWWPAGLLFDRQLHFLARLSKTAAPREPDSPLAAPLFAAGLSQAAAASLTAK